MATKRKRPAKQETVQAARITIEGPGRMTASGRRSIAAWLRQHAAHLLKHGKNYTEGRFTGRYLCGHRRPLKFS